MESVIKGKIYAIRSFETNDIYIGSTTQKYLSKRFQGHKKAYKRYLNNDNCYVTSFKILKYDDAYIELVEELEVKSKDYLRMIEGEYIRTMHGVVNRNIAGGQNKDSISQKKKEYREANKETISQKKKEYREANKETISQKKKEYREANKETISQKKKEYREANKETISQKKKEYREANKDKIRAKKSEKCVCECGIEYTNGHKSRHEGTKRHMKFILNKIVDNVMVNKDNVAE